MSALCNCDCEMINQPLRRNVFAVRVKNMRLVAEGNIAMLAGP